MRCEASVLCIAWLASLPALSAQSSTVLLAEGDSTPAGASVRDILELQVGDDGTWLADALTKLPFPIDRSLLGKSSEVREGMRLDAPPGATLDDWSSMDRNARGDVALAATVRPFPAFSMDALYWNQKLVALEGDAIASPLLPAGSSYDSFDVVRLDDRDTLIMVGMVHTPIVPFRRPAMVAFQLDALGNVVSATVLATRNQSIASLSGAIVGLLASNENSIAVNGRGQILTSVLTTLGTAILLDMDVPLAVQGASSSVGRNWLGLSPTHAALNDRGEYVLTGRLEGSTDTYLIEKNGAKFAQEGDVIPALSPLPLAGSTGAPIHLANNGDVFWHARVQGAPDQAFLRNHEPIVRVGTLVDGRKVVGLETDEHAFTISPDGRYFACIVELADDTRAALLLDFGLVLELPGCAGNPGELALAAGQARVGQTIALAMDDGPAAGGFARIDFAAAPRLRGSECGVTTPAGEVLISRRHLGSLFLAPWDGTRPTSVSIAIPDDLALLDKELYAQGSFRTPGTNTRSLTNALLIEIGAP